MTNPQIGIYDAINDVWEYRDMNDEELAALAILKETTIENNEPPAVWQGDVMPHMVGE